MPRFWSVLAVQLGKRAGLVAVIGLLVTIGLGMGITQLEFATGQDSYLNSDEDIYIDNVEYQDLFGGQAMLSVVTMDEGHTVDELFTDDGRARFEQMSTELTETGRIQGIITPLTALDFSDRLISSDTGNPLDSIAAGAIEFAAANAGDEASAEAREADLAVTAERLLSIPAEEQVLSNPEWVRFLLYDNDGGIRKALLPFFPNPQNALVIVRLEGNESIDEEGEVADVVAGASEVLEFPDATVTTAGAPELLRDINEYLRGGMLTLGGIAVAIMVVILLVLFDVRWRLLPLAVVLIGVTWAFGLAGYLGIPLTIVTIAGLPVMLGVGIDYAIQMHSRVEEEVILDRSDHPIQETARNLGPALLVVTFDAIFAFTALRFAQVPMIREFGVLLSVGIAVICLGSILLPLAALGAREYRSPTHGKDFSEGALGRLVVRLGGIPARFAVPLAVVSLAVFAAGLWAEGKLVIQTDPVEWVNQDSEVIQDLDTIEEEVGGSSELGIFISDDESLFRQDTVDYVDGLERQFSDDERIAVGSSIVGTVRDIMYVPGAEDVTPRAEDVQAAWEIAPVDIQTATAADEGEAFNIIYLTGPGSLEDRAVLVDDIESFVDGSTPPGDARVTPSGLAVVGVGLLENLEANRILLTYLAILFVGIFLSLRLRSVVRSLLSLVPVLIAVGTASVVAWAFSLELSPMTAIGGPLVVAICTEFTSLILLRFVEERDRGLDTVEAMDVAAARTGRAFIVSALTGVAGVAVLSFSSLPLLRDFGRVVAMNVSVALLSALVILPPLMIWADAPSRRWVSKGMVNRHAGKYVETPYEPAPEGV